MLDTLLSGQLLFAALATGAAYALVALGLNLVYGTMRLLNVAHGDLVMLGAYGAFWGFSAAGLSPLMTLLIVAMAGSALGMLAYRGLFSGLLASQRTIARLESNSMLLFFGLSIIIQNAVALAFSATPRGYEYLSGVARFGNVALTGNRLAALAIAVCLLCAVMVFLRVHLFGLAMRALVENREASVVVGVDVDRVQLASFGLAFATAAAAGALVSMTEQVSPHMGFPFTIASFVVIILGGLGRLAGGIAAALVLGVIETYGVALTSPSWRSILLYGIFVLVLLFLPQGLFGGRKLIR
jgi:branched-chain amino acid transport system permease protein